MITFAKLTDTLGNPVHINVDAIVCIRTNEHHHITVDMIDGHFQVVRETVEQVMQAINQHKRSAIDE